MKLIPSKQFEKRYRKWVKKNKDIKIGIDTSLRLLTKNIFDKSLETHKLTGKLTGLWACSCGYDCRIIFEIIKSELTDEQVIFLVDLGTHEEVY